MPWTPMGWVDMGEDSSDGNTDPLVAPSVEAIARALAAAEPDDCFVEVDAWEADPDRQRYYPDDVPSMSYESCSYYRERANAVVTLLPGRPEHEVKAEALLEAAAPAVAEWARKTIEDHLIWCRDHRVSLLNRHNGLAIAEPDGEPNGLIRMGFEEAWRRCLKERARQLDPDSVEGSDG